MSSDMVRSEAVDNLDIGFDKLYTQLQNFGESMRIQAECKTKTFERMLDILKDLQRDLQTPEPPEEVPADVGQDCDIKHQDCDSKPNTVISFNVLRPIAMKITVGMTYALDRQVKVSTNSSSVPSLATQSQKLRNVALENSYGVQRLQISGYSIKKISGYESNGSELSCLPTVCQNASMCWPFVIVDARFLKPPAKPPDGLILGKVDVRKEVELPQICDVQEFLTIVLFSNGVHKHYIRQIVNRGMAWIWKSTRPTVADVGIVEEEKKGLDPASTVVLSFLNALVCPWMVMGHFRREYRATRRAKSESAHNLRIECLAMTSDRQLNSQCCSILFSQMKSEYAPLKWENKVLAAKRPNIISSSMTASGDNYTPMGTSVSVAENLILTGSISEKQALLVVLRFLLEDEAAEERSFSDEVLVRCQHLEDEVGKIIAKAGVNHSTSKIAWDSKVAHEKELPIDVEQVVEGQKTIDFLGMKVFLGMKLKSFYILGDFILGSNKPLKICDKVSLLELTDSHSNWFYKPNSNSEQMIWGRRY